MAQFPETIINVSDVSDEDIEHSLRIELVRKWVYDQSPSKEHTTRLVKKLSYAWFEKTSTVHEPPEVTSLVCLKDRFRTVEGLDKSIFAIGCLEKVIKRKGKPVSSIKLYLLGFIDTLSPFYAFGTSVEPEFELQGTRLDDQAVLFPCSALTWQVFESGQLKPEPELVLSRPDPLQWIYIYHWDPPRVEDINRFNLEREVMARLKSLHLKQKMPIDSVKHYQRDRFCTHALILAACTDENVEEWYLEAESSMLAENLTSLGDFEDRILTMRNNCIEFKSSQLEVYETFDIKVIDLNRDRLSKAIAAARRMLTSEKYLNHDPHEGEEEFFVLIQKIRDFVFDLIQM